MRVGPSRQPREDSGERRDAGPCGRWRRGRDPPPRQTVPRPWGPPGPPEGAPSELLAVAPAFAAFAALAGSRAAPAPARPGCDDVVDPKHHDRRVRRRGNGLAPDPNRLDHVLLLHVGDFAAEHVDPRRLVPLLVLLAQLDQDVDWVETRVLREGPWDDLDGIRERFDGDLLAPADSRREVAQGEGNLHRTRTAAGDDLAVLNRDRDDARRVLEDRSSSSTTCSVPPRRRIETAFGFLHPVTNVISSSPIFFSYTSFAKPRSSFDSPSSFVTTLPPVALASFSISDCLTRRTA